MDTLRIIANPMETAGGYGVRMFWRLLVNDIAITDLARPFAACDSTAKLHECIDCYVCGKQDLSIRRYCDCVIWTGSDPEKLDIEPGLTVHDVFVFDAKRYQAEFDSASYMDPCRKGNVTELPDMVGSEPAQFARLVSGQEIPDWRLGLYTVPELVNDSNGQGLLRMLGGLVARQSGNCRAANPPQSQCLRIGLDLPEVPECVIELGNLRSAPAIRMVEMPRLPIWLTGAPMIEQICSHVLDQ